MKGVCLNSSMVHKAASFRPPANQPFASNFIEKSQFNSILSKSDNARSYCVSYQSKARRGRYGSPITVLGSLDSKEIKPISRDMYVWRCQSRDWSSPLQNVRKWLTRLLAIILESAEHRFALRTLYKHRRHTGCKPHSPDGLCQSSGAPPFEA